MGNSRIENTDVNSTVLVDRFVNEGFNSFFICSVRDNRMKLRRRSGIRFQRVHSLRELSSIDVDDNHRCTFLEETGCRAKSDSLGATGDDCDFAVRVSEIEVGEYPSSRFAIPGNPFCCDDICGEVRREGNFPEAGS
jgi:hypothetical protein